MDSRLHGVPVSSTTQMAPKVPVSTSLSGIRAPLTMDDFDFEYSGSTKSLKNSSGSSYSSGSEVEYEGFVSGEDEFESTSERHFETDADDEIREETHFVKEYAFSSPVVKSPDDEIVQRRSNVNDYGFSRPFVKNPYREIVEESHDVIELRIRRPFVKSLDEETIEERNSDNEFDDSKILTSDMDEAVIDNNNNNVNVAVYGHSSVSVVNSDEESLENDPIPIADIGISELPKMAMPIALVTGDSDVDSPRSDTTEDDGFFALVRVPSTEMLQGVNSALKVRILDVEEEESEDSQSRKMIDSEFVQASASSNNLNGVLSSQYEEEVDNESESLNLVEPKFNEDLAPNNIISGVLSSEYEEEKHNELWAQNVVEPEFVDDSALDYTLNDVLGSKCEEKCILLEDIVSMSADPIGEANTKSLGASKEYDSLKESLSPEEEAQLNEEIHSIDNKVDDRKCVDSDSSRECNNLTSYVNVENEYIKLLGNTASPTLEAEQDHPRETMNPSLQEMEVEVVSFDDGKCGDDGVGENCVLSQSNSTENKCEHTIDWTVASEDYTTGSQNESVTCATEINELQAAREVIPSINVSLSHFNQDLQMEDESIVACGSNTLVPLDSNLEQKKEYEGENVNQSFPGEVNYSLLHDENELAAAAESRLPSTSLSEGENSGDLPREINRQVRKDKDGEVDSDRDIDSKQITLAELLKAFRGAAQVSRGIKFTSADGTKIFSLEHPSNLDNLTLDSLAPNRTQPSLSKFLSGFNTMVGSGSEQTLSKEEREKLENLQQMRVRYLRLVDRLGQSPKDPIASQILYQIQLAAGTLPAQEVSLECGKTIPLELEEQVENPLDFSLNILVIGKTGVGKSATINSIFKEEKSLIDAFQPATTCVKEIEGSLGGIRIHVLDTPGLRTSFTEQSVNRKILLSIKKYMRKCPPDVVLYVDRVDTPTRDLTDLPMLKSVTTYLGSSIWQNAIIVLTHAASTLPDGPFGNPFSYDVFVAQQSRVVQNLISHSAGDLHVINPVAFVENHQFVEKNKDGEIKLPNGETWRSQLLLLCHSMKILSEVNSVVKNHNNPLVHKSPLGFPIQSPSLPYFLSSLLQSISHPKLSNEKGGENFDSDIEIEYSYDSNDEVDDDYDQLPPFKPLKTSLIAKLSREQRKAYFEEYDYRVKLLQKKQWREEMKRLRNMKKKRKEGLLDHGFTEDVNEESETPVAVAVPLADLVLPSSFDGDNPSFRYCFLETTSHFLARPVFSSHGWDHDCGYDGVVIENDFASAGRFPAVFSVQLTKDKKEFIMHLNSSVSAKHGENDSAVAGLEIRTLGKQFACTLKGDKKFRNFKANKTSAGVSITFLGKNVVSGLKVEDRIAVGKRLVLVGNAGAIQCQGDAAYGANLEVHIREKDYPIGKDQSSLCLSLMRWRGDLIWGCNLQSEFSVGQHSKLNVQAGLNKKLNGQVSVRTSSSELQIAVLCLLPIARAIFRNIISQSTDTY